MYRRLGSLLALLAMSLSALSLLYLLTANQAVAANVQEGAENGYRPDRPRRMPPQVAVEACQGLAAGTHCQFTARHGERLAGECFIAPDDQLACKPEGHDRLMKHRPEHDRGSNDFPQP